MKHKYLLIIAFLNLCYVLPVKAYSLLTHEAIIDVSWEKTIQPLLLSKYPNTTSEQLIAAHSYAYGGAIMPDIGYSPFGSMIYTNFVHNVRTGDYVEALLEEAENVNEFAFALGSLAHYMADNYGHLLGTNVAVPLMYPKVRAEFGNEVTYADDHTSHSRMELAFDVLQTARGNYASKNYHDFIGFNIARPVVEKAFYRTYGIDVNDVFGNMSVAISTFRWTIKTLLPNIVKTAWASKKNDLRKVDPTLTSQKFSYKMRNRTYYHEFGREHQKVGFLQSVFSLILPILPKIGPLAKLRFKTPTPEVEKLFIKSFDTTLVHYKAAVDKLPNSILELPNKTLDTGHPTVMGEYSIADNNHGEFLLMLYEKKFENLAPEIRNHFAAFYASAKLPAAKTRKEIKKQQEILTALNALKQIPNTTKAF